MKACAGMSLFRGGGVKTNYDVIGIKYVVCTAHVQKSSNLYECTAVCYSCVLNIQVG